MSQAPDEREQLQNKPSSTCLAAVVLAISLHAFMAWAIPFSNVMLLLLLGISSSIAFVLGRRAASKQAVSKVEQEPVPGDEASQQLMQGIVEFKATIQAFSEDQHSPGELLLQILDMCLEGKDPEEEDLHLLSNLFHQFSIFSEATQPLDLTDYADMEADVQEALLRLLGHCALHSSQARLEDSDTDSKRLHEVTLGLLPFDFSTVGTDIRLGTLHQKSRQNEPVGEAEGDLLPLSTMLAKLASAGASEYWQASRYSTEGILWRQPSLQSALLVLQGSRLPSKNLESSENLGNSTSHGQKTWATSNFGNPTSKDMSASGNFSNCPSYGQPSGASPPATPLHQAHISSPLPSSRTEGRPRGIRSSSTVPSASKSWMTNSSRPFVGFARVSGSRPDTNMNLSSSCVRAEHAASTDSKPPMASGLSGEPLNLLREAAMHPKSRMSFSNPNMQAAQSAASAETSEKVLSGHAIIQCLSSQTDIYSQRNSSPLESTENSSAWVQSSQPCVGLHEGTEDESEEQFFSGKEMYSEERSSANKLDLIGDTLKAAASAPGPIPTPFGLGQVMERQGSEEREGLENEHTDKILYLDAEAEEAEQSDQRRKTKEYRNVHFQNEAGRVAQPQGHLMLEMEIALEHAYDSFSFDAFHLNEVTQGHPLSTLSYFLFHKSGLISSCKLNPLKLGRFLQTIEAGYSPSNPYHNAIHATDVLQTLHVILLYGWQHLQQADPMLHLAGYLAAVVHDFEHGGYTNDFLKNTHSRLAIRYNDTAPLENHHVAAAFDVLFTSGHNFLCNLPIYDYTRLRKAIIDLVLATDMKQHFHFLSLGKGIVQQPRSWRTQNSFQPQDFSARRSSRSRRPVHRSASSLRMSSLVMRSAASMGGPSSMPDCQLAPQGSVETETIREKKSAPVDGMRWNGRSSSENSSPSSPWKGLAAHMSDPHCEVWEKESCLAHISADPEKRLLLLQIALKCADLGHTAEDLDVHIRWVKLLEEEFWRQGDQEKAANLPLSPLFDRTKPGISKSQVGFFDVVALPLLKILVSGMLGALPLLTGAEHNYDYWKRKKRQMQAQQQAHEEGTA